jgi:hypothetical protein
MKLIDDLITLIEESIENNGFLTKKQFQYCIDEENLLSYAQKKKGVETFIYNINQSDFLIAPLVYPHTHVVTKSQEKYIDLLIHDNDQYYFNVCQLFHFKDNDLVGLKSILKMFNDLKNIILQYDYHDKIFLSLTPNRRPVHMDTDLISGSKDSLPDLSIHDDFIKFMKNNIKIQAWFRKLVKYLHTKEMICCAYIQPEALLGMVKQCERFEIRDLSRDKKQDPIDDSDWIELELE